MEDLLGDRMKRYEGEFSQRVVGSKPLFMRLDGKNFSKWTKQLDQPFDSTFSSVMSALGLRLSKEFSVTASYVQSDEITLFWEAKPEPYVHPFGGKVNKLVSLVSSQASVWFNELWEVSTGEPSGILFDGRAFIVPESEISDAFKWRFKDCWRNSISKLAQHHYSAKELYGCNSSVKKKMIKAAGDDWESLPDELREGVLFAKTIQNKPLADDVLERIPAKYRPLGTVDQVVYQKVSWNDVDFLEKT